MDSDSDNLKNIDSNPRKLIINNNIYGWKFIRFLIVSFVFIPLIYYWWTLITVLIGTGLMVFDSDRIWKRHGFVIAFAAGISTFMVGVIRKVWPLSIGLVIYFLYFIIILILETIKIFKVKFKKQKAYCKRFQERFAYANRC